MSSLNPLENFDTSHWKTDDKSWMKEREKQWPEIEQMLYALEMTKKGRGIVKRYFLKGSLPHWKKLHDWDRDSTVRHLNLLLFLYLHPCQDETVLRSLRDQFMEHPQALPGDRLGGFTLLFSIGQGHASSGGTRLVSTSELEKELPLAVSQLPDAPAPYAHCKIVDIHTNGHNERLFNLMLPDLSQDTVQLPVTRDTYVSRAPRYFPWDHEELPLRAFRFALYDLWTMDHGPMAGISCHIQQGLQRHDLSVREAPGSLVPGCCQVSGPRGEVAGACADWSVPDLPVRP